MNAGSQVIQGYFGSYGPRLAAAPFQGVAPRPAPGVPQRAAAVPPKPAIPGVPAALQLRRSGGSVEVPAHYRLGPKGPGQPLPEPVRTRMESFFGTSFERVRVHVGPEAGSIGAHAFTMGEHLFFSPGQYAPHTTPGQRLLGHELTHVVQQRSGRVRNPFGSGIAVVQEPHLESEADRLGAQAAQACGAPATVQRKAAPGIGPTAPPGAGAVVQRDDNYFAVLGRPGIDDEIQQIRDQQEELRQGRIEGNRRARQRDRRRRGLFDEMWNATQPHHLYGPSLDQCQMLIVSENERPRFRTGNLYPRSTITRTYYSAFQDPVDKEEEDLDWRDWNWVSPDPLPFGGGERYERIIARSMICACENEHYHGGRGPHGGSIRQLCGGIELATRGRILDRMAQLLRNHPRARAFLTVSPRLHYQDPFERSAQRKRAYEFWNSAVRHFNANSVGPTVEFVRIERGNLPVRTVDDPRRPSRINWELQGDFFGLVMLPANAEIPEPLSRRRGRRRRKRRRR